MPASLKLFAPFAAALAIAGCNAGGPSVREATAQPAVDAYSIPQWQARNLADRACPDVPPGQVQCDALILNESPQDKEP
jgi:hypothetical protein